MRESNGYNNRISQGTLSLSSKNEIIECVESWVKEGDITGIYETTDDYISYESSDEFISAFERRIYFPENDSLKRIRDSIIYDNEVEQYINIDKVAEFIYNCIDVNSLACVRSIALLWDNDDTEDFEVSNAREELMERVTDGCDEYAYEIGLGLLGVTWVERSTVIINVGELVKSSYDIAKEIAIIDDCNCIKAEAENIFREGLIQTICHEFRHLFYEVNEFTEYSGVYPRDGGIEQNVEDYGNSMAHDLLHDEIASKYIYNMFEDTVPGIKPFNFVTGLFENNEISNEAR